MLVWVFGNDPSRDSHTWEGKQVHYLLVLL